jgi:hypothetical protein
MSQAVAGHTKTWKGRNSGHHPRRMTGVDLYEHFALKIEPSTEQLSDKATAPRMDWLFTDEAAAANLIVIVGASLFAIVWHLYGP